MTRSTLRRTSAAKPRRPDLERIAPGVALSNGEVVLERSAMPDARSGDRRAIAPHGRVLRPSALGGGVASANGVVLAAAAIIGRCQQGPSMASADMGSPSAKDHGVGNRREENLHAQFPMPTGRPPTVRRAGSLHPAETHMLDGMPVTGVLSVVL